MRFYSLLYYRPGTSIVPSGVVWTMQFALFLSTFERKAFHSYLQEAAVLHFNPYSAAEYCELSRRHIEITWYFNPYSSICLDATQQTNVIIVAADVTAPNGDGTSAATIVHENKNEHTLNQQEKSNSWKNMGLI